MADQTLDDFLGVKPQPRWRKWVQWGVVILGVVLLAVLLKSCFGGSDQAGYATAPVSRGNLTVTVSATGKLAPTNQVTVGSQLSGLVTKVVVDVNDRVKAGEALALIDPEQIDDQIRAAQATLSANQAQVAQARATVAESQAQLRRLEEVYKLSNGRVPSGTELQTGRADAQRAVAALRVAEANVAAARAQLAQSQTQRQRAIIRSPVSGVVLARQVDPGQTVAASFNTPTLFVIAEDLTKMKLEVAIDEADVGEVKVGQKANFTVDAFPGRTFPATITRVDLGSNLTVSAATSSSSSSTASTSTTGQVVSYAADLTVANPDLQLRPGMTATADIVTSDKRNVVLIPNAALRFQPSDGASQGGGGGIAGSLTFRPRRDRAARTATVQRGATQTVYVRGTDGKPQPVQIVTGDTNGSMTEVLSGGLKPGMQVITGQLAAGEAAPAAAGGQRRQGQQGGGGGR
ncbi:MULTISPECIES: efflux RND transporter periplasmic adaptor subunit [unclassified Sphingomonas]|uniref:efflux RND transporter periplasmic adaptor subunit n=1 Tax=unclassified Sphingomonas TaxID=196159 RepID=UPI00285C8EFF|nr:MULTISPECIES: efflux RND transporter periplasmic adaptor subunit [unclassified Sphingomonas]MDR6114840.1 HlyD family secretion protein [Sphingomonas sp. SORGH_AS_0789]MDR6151487.1 HlyD family secretion protein [Sphingomonas sp. SORGH_AS_0742]